MLATESVLVILTMCPLKSAENVHITYCSEELQYTHPELKEYCM